MGSEPVSFAYGLGRERRVVSVPRCRPEIVIVGNWGGGLCEGLGGHKFSFFATHHNTQYNIWSDP
jgi:hypothetical protein